MKKIKELLTNALYGMLHAYEGKRFVPSLIAKLVMSLASAIITAFFASTLFSRNNTANQVFAALFFYFLITAVSNLIAEIKRKGVGKRLKNIICNMVCLKPPALWFFIAAFVISLFLPYAFVLSLAALLFVSAVSEENSVLLGIKNAVTKGKNPERNGKGLAAFTSGLIACGLIVCILADLGIPTVYDIIDGGSMKNNITQGEQIDEDCISKPDTTYDTETVSDHKDAGSADNSAAVSGDTDIKEAAKILTDKLIEYAGNDKESFEKLFRNTESAVIDQYYNISYDAFKEYGNSLIAIAAQDDSNNTVWFTALYCQLPKNYPSEKEKSVYLSTIMTCEDDGWKIEWNDDVRSKLQSKYDNVGFSSYCLEAKDMGYAWAKFFIPFDPETAMIFYDGAVMCKLTEMYIDENDNLNLTFYASNGADRDAELNSIDITVSDVDRQLFSKNFEVDTTVRKGESTLFALKIYSDELDFNSWISPKITDFRFDYNEVK